MDKVYQSEQLAPHEQHVPQVNCPLSKDIIILGDYPFHSYVINFLVLQAKNYCAVIGSDDTFPAKLMLLKKILTSCK